MMGRNALIGRGVWSCVGSTNFDRRALQLNDEVSLGVLDPAIAAQLRAAFETDLKDSERRTFEEAEAGRAAGWAACVQLSLTFARQNVQI